VPLARAQPALQHRPQCLRSTLAVAACPCKHAWGLFEHIAMHCVPGVSPRLAWCDACAHALARSQCEVMLEGEGPWKLPDGGDDMEIVFTPGHTAGHCVLIHKAQRVRARCPF